MRQPLIIYGDAGRFPFGTGRDWRWTMSDGRILHLHEVGHYPWREDPAAFFPGVATFPNNAAASSTVNVQRSPSTSSSSLTTTSTRVTCIQQAETRRVSSRPHPSKPLERWTTENELVAEERQRRSEA